MNRAGMEERIRYRTPRVEICENPDAVILKAEMPGVAKEDFDIKVDNSELTIKATRRPMDSSLRLVRGETDPASYLRTFVLGDQVDTSKISAKVENGILTLTLPKKEEVLPKKIAIEA